MGLGHLQEAMRTPLKFDHSHDRWLPTGGDYSHVDTLLATKWELLRPDLELSFLSGLWRPHRAECGILPASSSARELACHLGQVALPHLPLNSPMMSSLQVHYILQLGWRSIEYHGTINLHDLFLLMFAQLLV